MSESSEFKITCPHCGGHVAFALRDYGELTPCPHCTCSICLQVAGYTPPAPNIEDSIPPFLLSVGHPNHRKKKSSLHPIFWVLMVIGIMVVFFSIIVGSATDEDAWIKTRADSEKEIEIGRLFETFGFGGFIYKVEIFDDQVRVQVTRHFGDLPFDQKRALAQGAFAIAHEHRRTIQFLVFADAATSKSIGMYNPSYGLRLD